MIPLSALFRKNFFTPAKNRPPPERRSRLSQSTPVTAKNTKKMKNLTIAFLRGPRYNGTRRTVVRRLSACPLDPQAGNTQERRRMPMAAIIIGALTLLVTAAALVFQIYVWTEGRKKENRLR
jgi:hypothetical protein